MKAAGCLSTLVEEASSKHLNPARNLAASKLWLHTGDGLDGAGLTRRAADASAHDAVVAASEYLGVHLIPFLYVLGAHAPLVIAVVRAPHALGY